TKGQVTFQDPTTGRTLKSTRLTSLVITGTHARVFGEATLNGAGSYRFVIDVDDLAEPGNGMDRFSISVSDGYAAGGAVLSGGNIQLH
ncbi:MAG TPA: post-COAP-1 domain-containing protein, partial [Armatimonadota bacterium]|nr:post-COAP-1 domain-containing protein [Armatimonadota bacterium]